MRDLDLVVSVAHSGGVDPETTESSIDIRRRLVEETADLLALGNVAPTGHHARIRGTLGTAALPRVCLGLQHPLTRNVSGPTPSFGPSA